MKRTILLLILFVGAIIVHAPKWDHLVIALEVHNPYETIWEAVCQVESNNNPLAYNKKENAVGIAQIRPILIKDYNLRTGKKYLLQEMYDPEKSREVFIYYARRHKNTDLIIRKWNGSGQETYAYLEKVKKYL